MRNVLIHVGRSKRDGAKVGSGRYPLGSGDRPYQGRAGEVFKKATTKSIQTKKGSENITPASAAFRETENISRSTRNIVNRSGSRRYRGDYSSMSDSELRQEINRMRLERDYEMLMADKSNVKSGKERTIDLLDTIGDVAAIGVSAATIIAIANDLMKD